MSETQKKIWNVLISKDAETAVRLILDYHGDHLLDDGFGLHLVDEGECNRRDIFDDDDFDDNEEEG